MTAPEVPPILSDKHHDDPSAFTPENLLREARRQKSADAVAVPKVCLLDPDGDIVRQLRANGRALRHEGWVCYHYLPPSDWSSAPGQLLSRLDGAFEDGPRVLIGATWTTDAPFRETEAAIAAARARGILAVEMEAAGLYAFAQARDRPVICLAHVTNQMGAIEGDFEKGDANGTFDALAVVSRIVARFG